MRSFESEFVTNNLWFLQEILKCAKDAHYYFRSDESYPEIIQDLIVRIELTMSGSLAPGRYPKELGHETDYWTFKEVELRPDESDYNDWSENQFNSIESEMKL